MLLTVAAVELPAFVQEVSLHPNVYLHLCKSDIILANATEVLGSCYDALHAWKAHSEAVFDAQIRKAMAPIFAKMTPFKIHIGRPASDICPRTVIHDHKKEGKAHSRLHPSPLAWFRTDAWFDGRDVHFSGVLASYYKYERRDAFRYIIAHELAHATETTEEGCDAAAERAVRLTDESRAWLKSIRSQR